MSKHLYCHARENNLQIVMKNYLEALPAVVEICAFTRFKSVLALNFNYVSCREIWNHIGPAYVEPTPTNVSGALNYIRDVCLAPDISKEESLRIVGAARQLFEERKQRLEGLSL
jgi:hypothetical protein